MKFRFDDQPHQAAAVASVVDLFEGALLPPLDLVAGLAPGAEGHVNFRLDLDSLAANLAEVTDRESVPRQDALIQLEDTDLRDVERAFPNFSVEMETGTGKTYVYIETALRMAELYGLRKFVILVHSVAIRAGVVKTFEQTSEHFATKFPSLKYRWGVLGETAALTDFADPSSDVQFLIASIQSLDKPDTNTLYSSKEQPQLWGNAMSGVAQIAETRPVVLIDEPQNMATTLRRKAIATLNPLVALRFSATHAEPFNLVHRLGPKQAAESGLVKRVSVKGIVAGEDGTPYIRVEKVRSVKKRLMADAVIDRATSSGTKRQRVVLQAGSDLIEDFGAPSTYRGLVVDEIARKPDRVIFDNGLVMQLGDENGVDSLAVWKDQIRQTIRRHLERQDQLDGSGREVKVLSLFFVERVADYVGDNAPLPAMFDEVFRAEWIRAGKKEADLGDPADVRVAYFPSTKTGILKDATGNSKDDQEQQSRAYEEIIANKELILDRANPRAFIFSHSALREGWDNPNVFQVGFLRHSKSDRERRQQIGRGLRLPVDSDGLRVFDPVLNRLTLVVDESFVEFRDGLNAEYVREAPKGSNAETPELDNSDDEVIIRRRSDLFDSSAFAELWERIRFKARYRVTLDGSTLAQLVADSEILEQLRYIQKRANVVQSADLSYDEEGNVVTRDTAVSEGRGERIMIVGEHLPNVVQLVEDQLQYGKFPLRLTRSTLAQILGNVPEEYVGRLIDDPDRWGRIVAQAIRTVTIEEMVKGIIYEPLGSFDSWDANTVLLPVETKTPVPATATNPDPKSGVVKAPEGGLNLYDHVDYDSHVERNFAERLESAEGEVRIFTKLPRRFRVRTPVGEYSPDWAIVYDQDGTERLYLVRETKDTLNLHDLKWDERMRIRFAARHFAAAPVPSVDYTNTTDVDGFRIDMELGGAS
ncbi:DEAD/DEAH box helicase family protein [Leifsonia sp. 1010]|uniref:restriction endonuclease n=1 Tax=Leifsonia sp. 1010 TaxID=2817769 RepID=UPI0028599A67|nr:DEAD/DEAH box helicase family protein [Leifsonia sp. 1010]MDR6613808.1 type III restriction enzyme [Leifsonia sp. 1010]